MPILGGLFGEDGESNQDGAHGADCDDDLHRTLLSAAPVQPSGFLVKPLSSMGWPKAAVLAALALDLSDVESGRAVHCPRRERC